MNANHDYLRLPFARFAGALALSLLVVGCTAAGATNLPDASSPPVPSGFYLRAWQSQALAPQDTFGWLPATTIADGKFYDGVIAMQMSYPGPIYTGLSFRPISSKGIGQIVAEAGTDGLLGTKTDFTGQPMAGSITCHVQLIVDAVTHDLTGQCANLARDSGTPGSSGAFAAFWTRLTNLSAWLGPELGSSTVYVPSSLAVLVGPPAKAQGGIAPNEKEWPLTTPFASFGSPMGSADYRCAVVSGADLAQLLPVVEASNQLTVFVDSQATKKSLQTRALVPGEPSPC